jgi:deoxyribonuclease-4
VEYRAERGFGPVFTHTAYLINLATPDQELREKSIVALAEEIDRARILQADGVITHTGSGRGDDPDMTRARVIDSLERVLDLTDSDGSPTLLLENTAGGGDSFGATIDQLGEALRGVEPSGPERLGVCIDTCHAHAAGIPVSSREDWDRLVDTVARQCGEGAWKAIHANDCIAELGSHRDRHAWIGDGTIGESGFREMLTTDALAQIPAITEMPGDIPEKDEENVRRLVALRNPL